MSVVTFEQKKIDELTDIIKKLEQDIIDLKKESDTIRKNCNMLFIKREQEIHNLEFLVEREKDNNQNLRQEVQNLENMVEQEQLKRCKLEAEVLRLETLLKQPEAEQQFSKMLAEQADEYTKMIAKYEDMNRKLQDKIDVFEVTKTSNCNSR